MMYLYLHFLVVTVLHVLVTQRLFTKNILTKKNTKKFDFYHVYVK